MRVLNTDEIKKNLIDELTNHKFTGKLLLLSKNPTNEALYYKKAIIRRCEEFGIKYVDHEFTKEMPEEILAYINAFDKEDGYIILAPFGDEKDLTYLKNNIEIKDLDAFTYRSLGFSMEGVSRSLPQTARAIVRFLEEKYPSLRGKNIVISNKTTTIGKPLAMNLVSKYATVTMITRHTADQRDLIKNADIFISAIGKANFYDKSYFSEGMLVVDVGTTYLDGKIVGDVDYESLEDMDIEVLTNKKGIGALTTLMLLESLI
ncbi:MULTISPECIES: bifunctional 5,10-methylenetetrahydrofolate dehydrogenase/5,10-methenyltetrahydrofolate cyclohydrolase [Anaerococcus]|uniref:bifunctional 5,10-methylenetetrahydrofolate dehydrogenase/5,10-methenyltetrahydrofolate cyclohydrolase n=1 Tax=Anaerococcus TaxID=165779 RepID=UPI0027B8A537|nr:MULTISPECIES: bifunctional 5,10-methylenetetrahydrofolate dehydrogenase/5,10-methenyltetrahydrofolate cyclohydrolase [Anaerococcus]MDU2558484.1 bifunctional 5,10-methylenetetrahydrofolate dehydrogenase/5,10-methenyltetrahydrofolate cyclohydrolase [Anaerococcus prevotii]MDU2583965.1 bifunctional 5,10-methylenetetrahydrofolate dehydrogenase/5,10-methenyltetrahydrofolate cyclohydrolase [Anaerococcus prevotii]MDU3137501.1 bifunctional 5,10-methylenetetrahydrofolate dehydrogenase/5,10-methenyltetr